MAHSHRIAIYTVSLFLGLSAFTGRNSGYRAPASLSPERQRLLTIAHAQIGICEVTNPEAVERFRRTTGNKRPAAWCSSRCVATFQQAGIPLPRYITGAAMSWFGTRKNPLPAEHVIPPGEESQPGDLLGYINRGGIDVHHVGLQDSDWGKTSMVYDTEGNYGGCVVLQLRPKRAIGARARYTP